MRVQFAAVIGLLASTLALLVAAGGCEAIVGDSIGGPVQCLAAPGTEPGGLCPQGQACIGGVCMPSSCSGVGCGPKDGGKDAFDATRDMGVDRDATPPPRDVVPEMIVHVDAPSPDTSSPGPLGATCRGNSDCATGLCGTSALLTTNVKTPGGLSVCTEPCCTSAECNDPKVPGFVCYPSVGGNYCVDPTWIGLPAVTGTGTPGSACSGASGPTQCRSGVCTGSQCQDTCCLDKQCGSGTVCQSSTLDGTDTFSCGPSGGSSPQGGDCSGGCTSNGCVGPVPVPMYPFVADICLGACCNDGDCKDPSGFGTTSCNWVPLLSGPVLRTCFVPLNPSGGAFGSACKSGTDCATNLCYQTSKCTAPCCVNTDCPTGWVCGYSTFITVDLQVCVPAS